ncbi:hypothetical protein K435DRAFT_867446 [Dendrothele bispora CBS 962.96]|uniref:Uncharacterized protein n=1 Tax=Dendrothele bispora (strain CBS 962.96) TaxID=1314807 RepID=A0A4S8LF29_DENBC|nr:hypothetical protein K435DRAFT_867446 [Dendrothele bispora CBS 962.96]
MADDNHSGSGEIRLEGALIKANAYIAHLEKDNENIRRELANLQAKYNKLSSMSEETLKQLILERRDKEAWRGHLNVMMERMVHESTKFLENLMYDNGQIGVMLEKDNPNMPLRKYYHGGEGQRVYCSDYGDEDSTDESVTTSD